MGNLCTVDTGAVGDDTRPPPTHANPPLKPNKNNGGGGAPAPVVNLDKAGGAVPDGGRPEGFPDGHPPNDNAEHKDESGNPDEIVSKLLLLGAGESGKSTIFRQIKSLYGEGFTTEQRKSFRMVIDANIIQSMQTLIKYSDILDSQYNTKVSDAVLVSKNFITELDEEAKLDENIAHHISVLWADQGIKTTFTKSSMFQLPDSAEYFFQRVDVIAKPGYVPSFQDVLRCRARTSGIQTVEFTLGRHKFRMLDVGGQRNERKKWKQCFQ